MSRSKQLNFFIHPDDWQSIVGFNQSQNVIMMGTKSTINKIEEVYSFNFQVYLTKKQFIDNGEIFFDAKTNYINLSSSSVIQFSLGGFYPNSSNTLNRGRLYYVVSYFDNGSLAVKSVDFNNWASKYFGLFKKTLLGKNEFDSEFQMSKKTIDWAREHKATVDQSGLVLVGIE